MPKSPKKPRTAWQYFQADRSVRSKLSPEVQKCGDFGDITRALGQLWKNMDSEAREPYQQQVDAARRDAANNVIDVTGVTDVTEVTDVTDVTEVTDVTDVTVVTDDNNVTYEQFLCQHASHVQQQHPSWEYPQILDHLDGLWKQYPVNISAEDSEINRLRQANQQLLAKQAQLLAKQAQLLANQAQLLAKQAQLSASLRLVQQQVKRLESLYGAKDNSLLVSCGLVYLYWMSTKDTHPN